MDSVLLARMLFGSSMAFHIIFATLGVGITFMILLAELMRWLRKDEDYGLMAKRWTKGVAILLGVAIPSGTIVGVMLSLLWPGFMEIVGQVIALPFQIEIFAFFLEALFLSIYVYAADRLTPALRLVSVFFVALGATASAVLITDAHAWMNTPRGFTIVDGAVTNVRPLEAVFNPSIYVTAMHVVGTAYMTGAFVIASVAAYKLFRGNLSEREASYHRKGMMFALAIGLIMSIYTAINGHDTAKMLHQYLPVKLAAAEGLFETQDNAPLAIFGTPDSEAGRVIGGLEIPGMLSWLATGTTDGVVKGLYDYPRNEWPPLFVHTLFNMMVGIGFSLIGLAVACWGFWFFFKRKPFPKWLLAGLIASGPLAMIGIETGWIFSCTGRQPWTIYGIQLTSEAATQSGNLGFLFILFITLYAVLLVITALVMRFYFHRNPVSNEWMSSTT
ncbi:cytochrome ubiquinol oxidase subunit I [Halalkalibacterium halodurans]|uniref:Cytochrome d (Bd-type) ubiquinol oxidase subunit I n=1 Tax=Halalkalibacterium halodurans (strain ATCC BAA-125 / DSM 18197 / FERM 7344 / JCM 9153 / C-125) TaxID=272558 RepID=Q9KEH4_HALH5|nr:cytochrome ubiquinol oxidase subunit I [Halalkalibacterium halodurans]MED4080759.1 cytochrome ubiquinol oxidase subunit I [Halalkalibacterium halodurans]MED4086216.1 cytochrome ubiquinol oxidase subunit I [Halalkalibacterium halodurans]MED4106898.1 cytochrome ubiquinol oxidase subunit I [Halalkalibacterium halodurans]MED4110291.1 cytochrome ubiquinol oxidase subunit I [Halalkalibacterium halodurans]MED4122854.1 cytochrome ubiquinol oxidase subunit I [Halalkalibacterium halodurans]